MLALWLRRSGYSYTRIALGVIQACENDVYPVGYDGPPLTPKHLPRGYDHAYANSDIRRVMVDYAKSIKEDTDYLRAEVTAQLEELIGRAMEKVRAGDMNAAYVALQAVQTKSRLLGLNIPEQKAPAADEDDFSIEELRRREAMLEAGTVDEDDETFDRVDFIELPSPRDTDAPEGDEENDESSDQ